VYPLGQIGAIENPTPAAAIHNIAGDDEKDVSKPRNTTQPARAAARI